MTHWLDAYLLPLLMGLPLTGAFFVAVMPASDRITLRHVGMGASLLTALVALYATFRMMGREGSEALAFHLGPGGVEVRLALDVADLPALLALVCLLPMSLRAGAPRIVERTKGYVVLLLVTLALGMATILAKSSLLALTLLDVTTIPMLLLLGGFGGPFRGTASMRVGMLWLIVDAAAIASIAWLAARTEAGLLAGVEELRGAAAGLSLDAARLALVPVALAGLVRLAVVPFSTWLSELLDEAPVSVAALVVGVVMPLGALALFRHGLVIWPEGALALLGPAVALAAGSALLAGLLALVERDLRRFVAFAAMFHGAIAALALVVLEARAMAAALVFVPAMGTATAFLLFVTDALERRYLTRDSTELIGVSQQLPGLWRLFVLALLATVGAPFLAGGSLALDLLGGAVSSTGFAAAGLPPNAALWAAGAVGTGWVLLAMGAIGALKRLSSPPLRAPLRAPPILSPGQAARLWAPSLLVVAAGLLAPLLARLVLPSVTQDLVESARAIEEGAPAKAWRPVAPRHAFAAPEPVVLPEATGDREAIDGFDAVEEVEAIDGVETIEVLEASETSEASEAIETNQEAP